MTTQEEQQAYFDKQIQERLDKCHIKTQEQFIEECRKEDMKEYINSSVRRKGEISEGLKDILKRRFEKNLLEDEFQGLLQLKNLHRQALFDAIDNSLSVKALVEWASRQPNVKQIEAESEECNIASIRVLRKSNFVPNGIMGQEGPRFVWKK